MADKLLITKDLEGSNHSLIEVVPKNLSGETEVNHEKPQSGEPVSGHDANKAPL
jgi:hypothetical protein